MMGRFVWLQRGWSFHFREAAQAINIYMSHDVLLVHWWGYILHLFIEWGPILLMRYYIMDVMLFFLFTSLCSTPNMSSLFPQNKLIQYYIHNTY